MKTPHYLRVVQALAVVAAIPGCTSGPTPSPAPVVVAPEHPDAASGDASPIQLADAAPSAPSDVDAGYSFSSGPIVPPELPVGFA